MKRKALEMPSLEQLENEVRRVRYRSRYKSVLRSTVYTLVVVAALAVLVATIWMPVLQIYGVSMTPTLNEGDIVVSFKGARFERGDLVAFYLGNKILVKRCMTNSGLPHRAITRSLPAARMVMFWTLHSRRSMSACSMFPASASWVILKYRR